MGNIFKFNLPFRRYPTIPTFGFQWHLCVLFNWPHSHLSLLFTLCALLQLAFAVFYFFAMTCEHITVVLLRAVVLYFTAPPGPSFWSSFLQANFCKQLFASSFLRAALVPILTWSLNASIHQCWCCFLSVPCNKQLFEFL